MNLFLMLEFWLIYQEVEECTNLPWAGRTWSRRINDNADENLAINGRTDSEDDTDRDTQINDFKSYLDITTAWFAAAQ